MFPSNNLQVFFKYSAERQYAEWIIHMFEPTLKMYYEPEKVETWKICMVCQILRNWEV